MALTQAICPNCAAQLEIDNTKDAAICPYCGSAYVVEKAINIYNIGMNSTTSVFNPEFDKLIRNYRAYRSKETMKKLQAEYPDFPDTWCEYSKYLFEYYCEDDRNWNNQGGNILLSEGMELFVSRMKEVIQQMQKAVDVASPSETSKYTSEFEAMKENCQNTIVQRQKQELIHKENLPDLMKLLQNKELLVFFDNDYKRKKYGYLDSDNYIHDSFRFALYDNTIYLYVHIDEGIDILYKVKKNSCGQTYIKYDLMDCIPLSSDSSNTLRKLNMRDFTGSFYLGYLPFSSKDTLYLYFEEISYARRHNYIGNYGYEKEKKCGLYSVKEADLHSKYNTLVYNLNQYLKFVSLKTLIHYISGNNCIFCGGKGTVNNSFLSGRTCTNCGKHVDFEMKKLDPIDLLLYDNTD